MKINVEHALEDYPEYRDNAKWRVNGALGLPTAVVITRQAVETWLSEERARDLEYNFAWKGTRPWEIVNVTKRLDPQQIWIGFEFETGFNDKAQYDKAVNWLWGNAENFVIDREGCGDYPCEFTFSPVNLSEFSEKSYVVDSFIKKLNQIGETARPDDDYDQVGMHVNFSGPNTRALGSTAMNSLAALLTGSLLSLTDEEKDTLFGRQPYGYIFANGGSTNPYLEGKLFDSTHSLTRWRGYKAVANNLALLAECVAGDRSFLLSLNTDTVYKSDYEDEVADKYITNIYEILMGECPAQNFEYDDNPDFDQEEDDYSW